MSNLTVSDLPLAGLKLVKPQVFEDARGYFLETYHLQKFGAEVVRDAFVQDNLSNSKRGVLRGLHYQNPHPQGKLVAVIEGEIFDAVVDIRRDSPTFGKWFGVTLSESNHLQIYVPPGFAHGFCVTSEHARVLYKCTDFYSPGSEHTIIWNDPEIGIAWPVHQPVLSDKDAQGVRLRDALIV
ncbi:MAG: dTDP-4-dehydrorhamnose 3,5-epimerase [Gammaproteobacteria bacterium]|nr:dTDP-4-dehydrorhamnose 3,5-epimerase [Gammaproteobacteria bacterium]